MVPEEYEDASEEANMKISHENAKGCETESPSDFIRSMLWQIVNDAVESSSEVKRRNSVMDQIEVDKRKTHRETSLFGDDAVCEVFNPRIHRRTVSECVADEGDKQPFKSSSNVLGKKIKEANRKKKFSLTTFLGKKAAKDVDNSHSETYDRFESLPPSEHKLKKSVSALELTTRKPQRSNSFIKKVLNLGEESTNFLKRSLSVRDVTKKKESSRKTSESGDQKWKQSLQSLVEMDVSISYNDLSFINYNPLNDISYENEDRTEDDDRTMTTQKFERFEENNKFIGRTQSMYVKGSPELQRPSYQRMLSASSGDYRSDVLNLSEQSGATSLPTLCHLNIQEKETLSSQDPTQTTQRLFQRRNQSITSEDGCRGRSSGSFRSASGGCAKLKRQHATRQKTRASLNIENRRTQHVDQQSGSTVRSRSLNHLDTLEMRQSVVPTSEGATLKDSRSEPDCTRSVVPPTSPHDHRPSTPTNEPQTQPVNRRHMLIRSQRSSSECFYVTFETGESNEDWHNESPFPAQRGFTLQDQISGVHNIDFANSEARLIDKENNKETIISFNEDSANLLGKHIRIIQRESTNKKGSGGSFYGNHSRKQSGSYRFRTSSTEDSTAYSSHDADISKKQIKTRFTAFFGNPKDSRMEALVDQLDKYTKLGIPSNQNYKQGQCESIDALYKLEDDWKDIVEYSDLNEKQRQQQTVLWELITTEVAYIKMLKVVTDLFLACLIDLQSKNLLKEIDTAKLFSNITDILNANVMFWRNTLFPLVRTMRQYKRPPCIETMAEGFSQIKDIFQPYQHYCIEQARCQHYCRENLNNDFFVTYLGWCESQKDCNRLRLMDILVQPMQRLTKYGLLLKAVLKNTDEDVEREALSAMIKMVDDFVYRVNSNIRVRQDSERLKGIIARIESYDIVESKDEDIDKLLKQNKTLMQLDLRRPMINCPPERKRHLLREGDLKLKDNLTSKMEVHCFLLTDMLLICKPSTKKGGATVKVIRQPYLVDRLEVHRLERETPSLCVVYKNEFDMAVAVFILQSNDPKIIKSWKDGIEEARKLYAQAKQIKHAGSLLYQSFDDNVSDDAEYYHSQYIIPKSPLPSSSRASRVSSLAHSHSGSVEMNDQSSIGSTRDASRGVSVENDNRTASISSDEGVQPLPPDKSPVTQQKASSFKNRLFPKTPNTLSVQPYGSLGQSLPNLTLGSPNLSLSPQNTLSVPGKNGGGHLLSPTHRGISYPPPSPTRGNLRRSLAISQNKNPPLIKTRQVNSASSASQLAPASLDFDVPVIAATDEPFESFSRGHHRQAMKRTFRYHTAGIVDDIKKNDSRDASIHKRLSWNCSSQEQRQPNEDQT
ncbi:uncharacterized protein LOC109603045 isoform X2 [Aethina tumida]|nr:uncharacterized protein LOC109603045 isoform X2 [Aethina tumida]